jgi:hypothetical protein
LGRLLAEDNFLQHNIVRHLGQPAAEGRLPDLLPTGLVHDALCQFAPLYVHFPYTFKQIDAIFLRMLRDAKWPYAERYYKAVRFWHSIRGRRDSCAESYSYARLGYWARPEEAERNSAAQTNKR